LPSSERISFNQTTVNTYKEIAKQARIDILGMIHRAQTSHIASNFSCIDIAAVVYENLKKEDRVVWSKGWAAAAIYYFNWKNGLGPKEAVDNFPNEPYFGLAETTVPGVLVNGGSVGHGLSVAVGMALAKKRAGETGTVYCIMSDGELNEGSVWEAVMLASHHKLDNLVAIIDKNGWQAMGKTEDVVDLDAYTAFGGFNWNTHNVNGHNYEELESALDIKIYTKGRPIVVIAETVKGKGVSFFENSLLYHYKNVDDETYQKAMAELCQN
jgi:transketolase